LRINLKTKPTQPNVSQKEKEKKKRKENNNQLQNFDKTHQ